MIRYSKDSLKNMKDGFSFRCRRCGNCCRHPGYVFLSEDDIRRLAEALGQNENTFMQKYCKTVCTDGRFRISLLERPGGECLFITDGGCAVYEARPNQCRTFPYWDKIINDDDELLLAKKYCPGIK